MIIDNIYQIIESARFAPSVHNTQSWDVTINGKNSLRIKINKNRMLIQGDPTGRQTIISLGIFAQAIIASAESLGYKIINVNFLDQKVDLLFTEQSPVNTDNQLLLKQRCSDRSIYAPVEITKNMIKNIEKAKINKEIEIILSTDKALINDVADLISRGLKIALSSPDFRKELSELLRLPWSSKKIGISVRSLYTSYILEMLQPILLRMGIGIKKECAQEHKRWSSSSGLVFILARGDMPQNWFDAGRSYLQTSLAIERLGLSQATSAAIVEASNYHEDVEEKLGTNKRILAVIRIGQGSNIRHYSPRLSVDDILHRTDSFF